jgi:hypothetical protein
LRSSDLRVRAPRLAFEFAQIQALGQLVADDCIGDA